VGALINSKEDLMSPMNGLECLLFRHLEEFTPKLHQSKFLRFQNTALAHLLYFDVIFGRYYFSSGVFLLVIFVKSSENYAVFVVDAY